MCLSRFLLLASLLLALTLCPAQQLSSASAAEGLPAAAIAPYPALTIFKRVDEVNLVLSATNHQGRFVRDLNPSDLVISDNGEPPDKITYFQTQTDLPLRVALVLDTSDSVNYRFNVELRAANGFLKKVLRPDQDAALIVGFNEKVNLVQPLTSDFGQLSHGLKSLKSRGETALFDALALAADQLRPNANDSAPARRVIVLVTDGEDNSSHINLADAVEHALRAESVIYVVNLKKYRVTDEDVQGDRIIQELASATGGAVLQTADNEDIAGSFRKIEQELRSQYALGYRPRHLIGSYLFRPIKIFGPQGIRIHCREGYYTRSTGFKVADFQGFQDVSDHVETLKP
jgi:Ca-activated chloride channel family protein